MINDIVFTETIDVIKRRMCIKTFYGNLPTSAVEMEIELFIKTGNCEPIVDKKMYWNQTFALESCWQVYYLASPFDAYFPVPVNDQLATDSGFVTTSPYQYCKSKLQALVTEFRSRRDRITFNFYFGDCLELCLENQKLRNKCQVVHCSDLADRVGLFNLILAASKCLSSENLDAVLVTDTATWKMFIGLQRPFPGNKHVNTIAEYVKVSLCCPLSLIPTLFVLIFIIIRNIFTL